MFKFLNYSLIIFLGEKERANLFTIKRKNACHKLALPPPHFARRKFKKLPYKAGSNLYSGIVDVYD